ncbi:DUF3060 domain-containing protein [Deinococcus cavernae]|uniref:DUF3060 domain-containing protein n=1 Tax=Deinococcus cavernae TaxID=2320857 RepID=A0A418V938_9DEIO|nr:DUF3060 domain-containing protein [Deinococcus cavernae]RJF72628.1 DUF3060 domain-containing protein [Deinococcus cavernae]
MKKILLTALACCGMAGAQSLSIGPNGVSLSTGANVTLRLDQNGLRVGVNQNAPRIPSRPQTLNCAGRAVKVSGTNGRVQLLGRCPSVTVTGSGNTVQVEQVGRLVVTGSRNRVTWRKALGGPRPTLLVTGAGNQVAAGGYVATRPAPVTALPSRPAPVRTLTPTPVKPVTTSPRPTAPTTAQPLR